MTNCPHSGEGWCLDCVGRLHGRAEAMRDALLEIEQVAHNPADLAPDLTPSRAGLSEAEALWGLVNRLGGMACRAYRAGG